MPTVICPNNYCIYNDDFEGICKYGGTIYAEQECAAFTSYRDQEDYQEEYWQACEKKGKKFRRKSKGKRIEVRGLVLYTADRLPPEELWSDPSTSVFCTEEETGMGMSLNKVFHPEAYECILKYKREQPRVMDLPERAEEEENEQAEGK